MNSKTENTQFGDLCNLFVIYDILLLASTTQK